MHPTSPLISDWYFFYFLAAATHKRKSILLPNFHSICSHCIFKLDIFVHSTVWRHCLSASCRIPFSYLPSWPKQLSGYLHRNAKTWDQVPPGWKSQLLESTGETSMCKVMLNVMKHRGAKYAPKKFLDEIWEIPHP